MQKNYNALLRELQEKRRRRDAIEARLDSLRAQLKELYDREQSLKDILSREQADVTRLENAGLASVFYAVLNKKEEKLEKEKAEAYAAALKHDAAVRQRQAAEYDLRSLESEMSGLSDVQERYDALFAEKAEAIKRENPSDGGEILKIEEKLGYLAAQQREIDEALSAGGEALSAIVSIEAELSSAEGWGTWDILGGGLVSSIAKHSHLDDAQEQINGLQELLRRYRTELADVTVHADVQAQIDGFLRFADHFFDGLLADWAVLDSIHSSQEQIASTRAEVEDVQRRLGQMKDALTAETGNLNARLREIVLES